MDGVPPPQIHMHIRQFDVSSEVPIGDLSSTGPSAVPNGAADSASKKEAVEADIPQAEKDKFDQWLRDLWNAKDRDLDRYLETGSFVSDSSLRVEIPIAIRRKRDALDAFCFFIPAVLGWVFSKMR